MYLTVDWFELFFNCLEKAESVRASCLLISLAEKKSLPLVQIPLWKALGNLKVQLSKKVCLLTYSLACLAPDLVQLYGRCMFMGHTEIINKIIEKSLGIVLSSNNSPAASTFIPDYSWLYVWAKFFATTFLTNGQELSTRWMDTWLRTVEQLGWGLCLLYTRLSKNMSKLK